MRAASPAAPPQHQRLASATAGLVTFGCPHRGSWLAKWGWCAALLQASCALLSLHALNESSAASAILCVPIRDADWLASWSCRAAALLRSSHLPCVGCMTFWAVCWHQHSRRACASDLAARLVTATASPGSQAILAIHADQGGSLSAREQEPALPGHGACCQRDAPQGRAPPRGEPHECGLHTCTCSLGGG